MTDPSPDARALLRHTLATLAYRAAKALRDAPAEFAAYRVAEGSRSPGEIVAHLGDLMEWGDHMARGEYRWSDSHAGEWSDDVERFFTELGRFDATLAGDAPLAASLQKLFQGSIADSLTHVGQLTMLRRLYGSPIRGENYSKADITLGRVGREQAPSRVEFD